MIDLISGELQALKLIFKQSHIQKYRGNNWNKTLLILSVYLPLNLFFAISGWYGIIWLFPVIEEADQLIIDSFGEAFLGAVILAPLLEETMFRLFLKFSRSRFLVSVFFISIFSFSISIYWGTVMMTLWLAATILFVNTRIYVTVQFFWQRNRIIIFWIVVFIFGLIHLDNYDLTLIPWYLYIPTVLPQLFGAVFLGIGRLRFGFFWAILLHASFNLIAILEMLYL